MGNRKIVVLKQILLISIIYILLNNIKYKKNNYLNSKFLNIIINILINHNN